MGLLCSFCVRGEVESDGEGKQMIELQGLFFSFFSAGFCLVFCVCLSRGLIETGKRHWSEKKLGKRERKRACERDGRVRGG